MIYFQKPADFKPLFEVVSCFCEYEDKILLLLRGNNSPQSNTWGAPAGKQEAKETSSAAMLRELKEETGFVIKEKELRFYETVFVRYESHDFIYHMFFVKFKTQPEVLIDKNEHKDFCWVTPQNALQLPLVKDMDACIKLFFKIK